MEPHELVQYCADKPVETVVANTEHLSKIYEWKCAQSVGWLGEAVETSLHSPLSIGQQEQEAISARFLRHIYKTGILAVFEECDNPDFSLKIHLNVVSGCRTHPVIVDMALAYNDRTILLRSPDFALDERAIAQFYHDKIVRCDYAFTITSLKMLHLFRVVRFEFSVGDKRTTVGKC